jgi:hypothetical protein
MKVGFYLLVGLAYDPEPMALVAGQFSKFKFRKDS